VRRVALIGPSDSSGGDGLQADLKTLTGFQVSGATVITSLIIRDADGIRRLEAIGLDLLREQLAAVLGAPGTEAAKTGLLLSREAVELVGQGLDEYQVKHVVVDPVLSAEGDGDVLDKETIAAIVGLLFPLATLVTPNLAEASLLAGLPVDSQAAMREAAKALKQLGPRYVCITGGHLPGNHVYDLLYDGERFVGWDAPKVQGRAFQGAGTTFAAAVTAGLAKGQEVREAVEIAQRYVAAAIRWAFKVDKGPAPVNHFVKP
jgi:hydroxymethylpyrimidine/phosphomethylpyrimidine kinase